MLKKLFIAASRRDHGGPATRLLENLLKRAGELDITDIVLDTPSVAGRSHAFYARNGFDRATAEDLPLGYLYPDRASLIFGDARAADPTVDVTAGRLSESSNCR